MKKAVFSADGMRQIVETGYRKFDRQSNLISRGCVISSTQTSTSIRPYRCMGDINKGVAMDFDLKPFRKYLPEWMLNKLTSPARRGRVMLYMFHTMEHGLVDPIGFIVTRMNGEFLYEYVVKPDSRSTPKRVAVIMEMHKYVCID